MKDTVLSNIVCHDLNCGNEMTSEDDQTTFSIAWTATYRLDGYVFHVQFNDGSSRAIVG